MLLRSSKRALSSTSTATCLPRSRGRDQPIDERRIGADPIQRHLDRHDVRIVHRRVDKRLDRGERVERMVHQLIAVLDLVEDLGLAPSATTRAARTADPSGPDARSRASAIQSASPMRPRGSDDDAAADLEVLDQGVEDAAGNAVLDLEQRERAVPLLLQAAVDRRQQVFAARPLRPPGRCRGGPGTGARSSR